MKRLIETFVWLITGCPMFFAGISASTAVAVGASVAGSVAGGVMSNKSNKQGMNAQSDASQLSMGYNAAAAAESYQKRLEAVAQANGISVNALLQANPQLIQGYQQASDIIRETYGGGAQAATAASGTDPKLLSQWQGQYQRGSEALKGAESELGNIKQQLSGLQWDGSPQTAVRIKQLQDAYNEAQVKRDTLQKQVSSVDQQIKGAQAYTPAQAAKAATVGRAPQALMTGANKAIGALNNAGKYVLRGKNEAGNALTNAFMGSGKDIIRGTNAAIGNINQGTDAALGYQQPFYKAGQTGLNNMTQMLTAGNNFQSTDPSYQWRLQQGLQGAENSAAARGSQLSGATLKALNNYGQGAASQEFQSSFGRNQQLAGMGQNAGNTMSGLESQRGTQLAGLNTSKGTQMANLRTGYGQNMGNLATGTASQMAGIKTNQGNIYNNLGQNLASQYNTGANTQAGYKTALGNQLYNGTMGLGETMSNRALGNADFFANTYGQAGRENAQMINSLGQQQNQYYQQQGQNNQNMVAGIANPIMQGMMLASDYGTGYGKNRNKYDAGGSQVDWGEELVMAEIMTPFELIGGMQAIKNNQLVAQMNQRRMQQADEEQRRAEAMRSLYRQTGGDAAQLRTGMINQGFGDQIPEFDQQQREISKEQRLTSKDQLESAIQTTALVAQGVSPFVGKPYSPEIDQQYQQWKAQTEQQLGKRLTTMPDQYEPETIARGYQQGMTVAQQLAQQYKQYDIQHNQETMDFNKQKFGQQSMLDVAKLAETSRAHDMSNANAQWYQAPGPDGMPVWKQGKREGAQVYAPTGISNKPMTEVQGKANIFSQRADEAHKNLMSLEGNINVTGLAAKQALGNGILGAAGNAMLSADQQKVEQAQRDFLTADLRLQSGAVISDQEMENGKRQYFPQPGDTPEVIEQKRKNRELEIKGMKEMAGPNSPVNTQPKTPKTLNFSGMTEEEISAFKQAHGM